MMDVFNQEVDEDDNDIDDAIEEELVSATTLA